MSSLDSVMSSNSCELIFFIDNNCDVQAKQQYEREERKNELKRQRGEDTWMLPDVNQRLNQIQDVRDFFSQELC